ncbi:hypothetical protein [Novosphingobium sp. Fuku2-ISO-50]|uniref:hypothetical protein n=1 Tax=Novosphingobium sp. Fuku2-ISO-50 TaxID=1739114 RepID=UPI00076C9E71|nr:hypothetical protein [Novosphingobium sp. Fuku2-ISO-50]KUR78740.1 hypothetical protein AQZ50_06135 [Novosphingobium sp. Fuku2-ISO-50]
MGKISEIILHIGLEKTGSTSIQMFLDDQKALLRSQGMFASGCLGWYNHKLLAAYAMADGSRDIAVTSAGIDGPESHQAFRARTRGHVLAEIERTDAHRYLISSEDLSRLTSLDDVRRVHDLMSEICTRIRVIVFLRRQDRLAVSRYYSLLINGGLPPSVFPAPDQAAYYDYAGVIEPWAEVFGTGAIRIVHYPEAAAAQGFDAIGAFCRAAGIVLPVDWQPPARRENVSLDLVSQTILEAMNGHSDVLKEKASGKRLLKLLQVADGGVSGQFVSAAEARAFYERYALGNARLARNFELPYPFFDDDFSMYPQTPARRADLAQDALVRMVGVVANLLQGPGAQAS